jgi:hypothetical protein
MKNRINSDKGPVANSDGLIKCLPQPGTASQSILKSMPLNSVPFIKFCVTGQFHRPGQHRWAAGHRAGASFFARHRDYFIVTRNFAPIYLDLVLFNSFTVTLGFAAIYRDSLTLRCATVRAGAKNAAPRRRRHLIKPPGR